MNAQVERLRIWWAGLAEREQRIVSAGGLVLALVFGYLAVWEPLAQARVTRLQALADARALAERLEVLAVETQRTRPGTRVIESRGQSLLTVVDQSAKSSQLGKAPSRLQPEGDNAVKLWLEDVPFDAVVRWLHTLESRHGVSASNADFDRESESGKVNVRLTLVRDAG